MFRTKITKPPDVTYFDEAMKTKNIFKAIAFSIFFIPVWVYSQGNFDFEKALRIDFILSGDTQEQTATIANYLTSPNYYGSPDQTHPDFDYGSYRILLTTPDKQDTLFTKGFCTLFEEWRATAEAKHKKRAFKQTIETPFPLQEVMVSLEFREKTGDFTTIMTEKFSPSTLITKINPANFPTKIIHGSNVPSKKLDLLILAEGYTSTETENFFEDAEKMVSELFKTPPYNKLRNKITIRAMAVTSIESGTNNPRKDEWKNTAMGSTFNTFGTDRYLESLSTWKIYDYAAAHPRDHIVVLVNTKKYGGGGVYNHFSITSAGHPQSARVLIHEMGHGLAGLGDEYYSSEVTYSGFFDLNTEPWHPNITTLVDFERKWKDLIDESVPVPTPEKNKYKNVTGLFEGAGYSAKGIYRPALNCRMKANEADGFCEVCKLSIEKVVNFYSK
ncbi:M64 family metallopeptidase [Marinilabilia salmonicolor]|uniref:M64 family metallopeptidase n=1 Tax=Marinilabilia salmonicolor TaxID=989 RepID=UPI00029B245D|nr:M64 family metallopeptidase [Marinilabilia salmonicolor]